MDVASHIDHTRRIVTLTITGALTDKGLLGLGDRLEKTPGIRPEYSLLIDLTGSDGSMITPAGVRAMAARRLALSPQSRRAVVVPNALGFGMARMYETLRGQRGRMRVFREAEAAYRWVETGLR